MDIDEIIASARLPERSVPLVLRGDLIAEWDRLSEEFARADSTIDADVTSSGVSRTAIEIAERMEQLREEIAGSRAIFRLRAVQRKRWRQMIAENPPAEGDVSSEVDEESFVTDMIAACCVEPALTREQAERLRDDVLTDGQWQQLATAAWQLNKNMIEVPMSLAAQTRLATSRALAAAEQ